MKRAVAGALLLAVLPFATACGAGKNNETDHEHATPWVAGTSIGSLSVRAVRVVPATAGPGSGTPGPSASSAQGYLLAAVVNNGTTTDQLTNVTVDGATVQPSAGSVLSFPPTELVRFGDPEIGDTGPALELSGLSQPLVVGTTMKVTMQFQKAGQVSLEVDVGDLSQVGSTATATPIPVATSSP
jgi:hypothetical protein